MCPSMDSKKRILLSFFLHIEGHEKSFLFQKSSQTEGWATQETNTNRPKKTTENWGIPAAQKIT